MLDQLNKHIQGIYNWIQSLLGNRQLGLFDFDWAAHCMLIEECVLGVLDSTSTVSVDSKTWSSELINNISL
jgi:hypothetical protein